MLKLMNITKTFAPGTVNQKTALCGIDLHLAPGDFVTVLGSNGAGKSTLFSAIAGSIRPDTGSVVLDGRDVTALPDYKRSKYIGRLFQDPLKGTAPNMTIAENLALAYLRSSDRRSPFSMVSAAERQEFRERLRLELGILRQIADDACIKVHFHLIAFLDGIGRFRTFQNREADVDGVAIEDPGKGTGDDAADAGGFQGQRGMLSGGAAAEVAAGYHNVTRLKTVYKGRVDVYHGVAGQFLRIEGVQISGRNDDVGIYVVTVF